MLKVLIVEHDPRLSDLYSHAFERAGFETKKARSAQDCVTLLDDWMADILVLDLGLPGHSGFEVLHELHSYDDWDDVPVVALTNVQPEHYPITDKTWKKYGVQKVLYRPSLRPHELAVLIKKLAKEAK